MPHLLASAVSGEWCCFALTAGAIRNGKKSNKTEERRHRYRYQEKITRVNIKLMDATTALSISTPEFMDTDLSLPSESGGFRARRVATSSCVVQRSTQALHLKRSTSLDLCFAQSLGSGFTLSLSCERVKINTVRLR